MYAIVEQIWMSPYGVYQMYLPENTHSRGSNNVWLASSLTVLDETVSVHTNNKFYFLFGKIQSNWTPAER